MARKTKTKKGNVVTVDFSGVQARKTLRGRFHVVIAGVKQESSEKSGEDYLRWTMKVDQGKFKGQEVNYNTSLQPQALWNLRGLLEAVGYEVEDGSTDIDLKEITSGEYGAWALIEPNERGYNEISRFETDSEAEEDEGETEEEDGERLDEEDIMKMSEDELEELIDDEDLDVDLDDFRGVKKKRQAVLEAYNNKAGGGEGEEGDLPDEDEIDEMNAKELSALVEEHDLDVKLEGSLKKKRRAVKKAIEELED